MGAGMGVEGGGNKSKPVTRYGAYRQETTQDGHRKDETAV